MNRVKAISGWHKRVFCMIISLMMMFSSYTIATAEGETATNLMVVIGTATGDPGQIVYLPINFTNVPVTGINNCDFKVHFDSNTLEFYSIGPGELITDNVDFDFDVETGAGTGNINIFFNDESIGDRQIKTDGTFALIGLKIKDTTSQGEYPISEVSVGDFAYFDANNMPIKVPVNFTNGKVIVNNINHAPTTQDYQVITVKNTSLQGKVEAQDIDNDTLAYSISSQPVNGTAALNAATGDWTYVPNNNYIGTDMFKVSVIDGKGGSVVSTVDITVNDASPVDTVKPYVVTSSIFNNAQGVPVNTQITLNFSENIKINNIASMVLKNGSNLVNITPLIMATTPGDLLINIPAPLAYNTSYSLEIGENAIADMAGNTLATSYVLTFTTVNAPQDAMQVTFGNAKNFSGCEVNIPITFLNIPASGINTTAFAIKYDSSKLEVIGITPGEIITTPADFKQPTIKAAEGEIYFLYSDSTGMFNPLKNNGVFATIKFKIKDTTQPGIYSICRIAKTTDSTVDNNLVTINPIFSDGWIEVKSVITGDIDGNGIVNATDFAWMQRYILNIISNFPSPKGMQAGDVDGNGVVNATDFAWIQRYILNLITQFPKK